MSYSMDQTETELGLFGSLFAATSRETTHSVMPVTPMMDTDVFVTTHSVAANNHIYNSCIDNTLVSAASMSAVSAACGEFLMTDVKNSNDELAFVSYQQYPPASGTLPRDIPYPQSRLLSQATPVQAYARSPAEFGFPLQGPSMVASSALTPQFQVASSELLSIGGVGQLGAGMAASGFLDQIVNPTHASTPRLHSQQHSYSSVGDGMGAFLPASVAPMYSMPITGPLQTPAEALFAPVCYADMSNDGSRRGSCAATPAAHTSNSTMGLSGGHIGQQGIPRLAQDNGLLGEGNSFSSACSFIFSPPVSGAGPSSGSAALSQSFTSGFSDLSLGSTHTESQAMSPSFTSQASSGVIRNSSRLARMRPGRSLSISEPFDVRSPSPALLALGAVPHTCAHPYFPNSAYQGFGGAISPSISVAALGNQSGAYSNDSGMETGMASSEGAWRHPKSNSSSRLDLLRSKSGPQFRRRPKVHTSALSNPLAAAAGSVATSAEQHSSDDDHSDDEHAGARTKADKDKILAVRTPLTPEQREIFFRWLYQNIHDPKPKGGERDRLRAIGNMSRERFKTWFANARRRYFTITVENGVQRYSVNNRFIVACQRNNIKLDE
ncbi:hypothetical protein GGI10_000691 [Coemansia sp. RSA 2530]|nr:hypothetical protein GGI10_000691 [Coemansia sp. RSA 2530]